jgi:hypothetical protein
MTFFVTSRWGGDGPDVSVEHMRQVLQELDLHDDEHCSVSLTHESGWSLGAFESGLLVWENVEEGEPRHLPVAGREHVLELWQALARGDLERVEREPWRPGYG